MSQNHYIFKKKQSKLRDDLIIQEEEKANNKFWIVKPLLKTSLTGCLLNEKSSDVAIDEQIIPFFGHARARQFIKGKPNPCGLKVFVATAPGSSSRFLHYQGSGDMTIRDSTNKDVKELNIGGKVVFRLSENLPPGCNLYMNRYCQGTGTLRKINIPSNVNLKTDTEMKRLGRGSADKKVRNDGLVCVVKWFDNKSFVLASSDVSGKYHVDSCKKVVQKKIKSTFLSTTFL